MNIDKKKKEEIKQKSKKLLIVKKQLKKEFVGLDAIIDELSDSIESWYLFPEYQVRPTTVNLWGMTGTGKTSLIKRFFELLQFGTLIKFDIGDFIEDSNSHTLKGKISNQLRKIKKNDAIPVFVFDEFQLGRTISKQNDDVDRSGLRIIWELIDSGKFDIVNDSWEMEQLMKVFIKLSHCVSNGVKAKNGSITQGKDTYETIFPKSPDDDVDNEEPELIVNPFIPIDKYWVIKNAWEFKFLSNKHLADFIMELGDEKSMLDFIDETLVKAMTPVEHDFSNSIIFNIGNLDEAYTMSDEVDPDIDPDTLYEFTEEITITDIKDALLKRFRAEQIGRLGNNHIIYRSFNSQNYKDLISLEMDKIKKSMKDRFDIELEFCDRVYDLVYKEGVFPTQGARPIFSTIRNIIESYIGKTMSNIFKDKSNVNKIVWDYVKGKHKIKCDDSVTYEYNVNLKVENLRTSTDDDKQAMVAIHESGHAIAALYALDLCPKMIMTKTANSSEGFVQVDKPEFKTRSFIENEIIVNLGGLIAEKLVFGEDNISNGGYSDLKNATQNAVTLYKNYGMGKLKALIVHEDFNEIFGPGTVGISEEDKTLSGIIEKCSEKCEDILNENMKLLLEMAKYLTINSKMEPDTIKEFVNDYGNKPIKYKDKDCYYNNKEMIQTKLNNLK